ncbi:unnamed protein product [Ostreobium quekettii]|uniref:Uncharacterized protein n=1 Tax=Ostreobium quekettii TaxID=121088 RepID=A0A8S1J6J0_9CHLO|nr:unnamed protein product [Ostreobium quekettii]
MLDGDGAEGIGAAPLGVLRRGGRNAEMAGLAGSFRGGSGREAACFAGGVALWVCDSRVLSRAGGCVRVAEWRAPRCGVVQHCSGVQSLVVSATGEHLFTASRDSTVKRWNVSEGQKPRFEASFDGHCEWVNDVVLVQDNILVTGASDKTLRVWDAYSSGQQMLSSQCHTDYVISLAAAPSEGLVASAGLRAEVCVWDLKQSPEMMTSVKLFPHDTNKEKGSMYAVALSATGKLVAAGSSDDITRIFDVREGKKVMKLKGHTGNIRALLINAEGTRLLSGSSDHTFKLWDLGLQRCVQTCSVHTDSVWSLLASENFNVVLSGGRDKCVYRTNMLNRTSELLFTEEYPITKMAASPSGGSIWVASASSSVNKWDIPVKLPTDSSLWNAADGNKAVPGRPHLFTSSLRRPSEANKVLEPLQCRPAATLSGIPAIVDRAVLRDQRHMLLKDQKGEVTILDVTSGRIVRNFGVVDFKAKEVELFEPNCVPKWFDHDNRLGMVTVTLETPKCFAAEVYARDFGADAPEDRRMNYGDGMLRSVLAPWAFHRNPKYLERAPEELDLWGKGWVDGEGKTVQSFRFWERSKPLVWVSSTNTEGEPWKASIHDLPKKVNDREDIPEWVAECVLRLRIPMQKSWKCSFHLLPLDDSLPPLNQSRLTAPRILQIRKVSQYLKQKLLELNPPVNVEIPPVDYCDVSNDPYYTEKRDNDEPFQEVTLMCKGYTLPFSMSVGSVIEYVWREPDEDLDIMYCVRRESIRLPEIAPQVS